MRALSECRKRTPAIAGFPFRRRVRQFGTKSYRGRCSAATHPAASVRMSDLDSRKIAMGARGDRTTFSVAYKSPVVTECRRGHRRTYSDQVLLIHVTQVVQHRSAARA